MKIYAYRLAQHRPQNTYNNVEESIFKTLGRVNTYQASISAHTVSNHVLYKLKENNDETLMLMARILAHRNEHSFNLPFEIDSCFCFPQEIKHICGMPHCIREK